MVQQSDNPNILSIDSVYSARANPRRGYHDYERKVTFRPETSEEVERQTMGEMRQELAKTNMWAYTPKMIEPHVWTINFGIDSGD